MKIFPSLNRTFFSAVTIFLSVNCFGSQTDSIPASADTTAKGALAITGFIDSYFFKNLNNPQSGTNLGKSGFERVFDQKEGQFQVGMAQIKFDYTHKKSEGVIDLAFGPSADLANYGNVTGPLGPTTSLAIKQAYFTCNPSEKFGITAGQFSTHIGFEYIDAPGNTNYSLSNLFSNGPFYHTGIKANFKVGEKLNFTAGILNNWDNLYDNNRYKTMMAQVAILPSEKCNTYINWIGGDEDNHPSSGPGKNVRSFKQVFDLANYCQITEKFFFGINGTFGMYENDTTNSKTWGGAALYTNYAFTKHVKLALRIEHFDNTMGVQYIGPTDVTSLTGTIVFTLADEHLFLKPEYRFDNYKKLEYSGPPASDIQQFQDSDGNFTKSAQSTVGVAMVYVF